jgi:PHP family Zn ribbon phosphoesterase
MQRRLIDLHIHTVLSACAQIEMIPPLIVRRAQDIDLDVIAITDHNCAENVSAVIEAARGTKLTVLPGMEVQTREEVHMLCLFDSLDQVLAWQQIVFAALPDAPNNTEIFGEQYIVDETGDYLYTETRLLATSTALSVEQVVDRVNALGGICLPAHVDRPSYSILSNLGFIPTRLQIAGVEITRLTTPQKSVQLFPTLARYGMVVSSDAHHLTEIAPRTQAHIAAPTVSELRLALAAEQGRWVRVLPMAES